MVICGSTICTTHSTTSHTALTLVISHHSRANCLIMMSFLLFISNEFILIEKPATSIAIKAPFNGKKRFQNIYDHHLLMGGVCIVGDNEGKCLCFEVRCRVILSGQAVQEMLSAPMPNFSLHLHCEFLWAKQPCVNHNFSHRRMSGGALSIIYLINTLFSCPSMLFTILVNSWRINYVIINHIRMIYRVDYCLIKLKTMSVGGEHTERTEEDGLNQTLFRDCFRS